MSFQEHLNPGLTRPAPADALALARRGAAIVTATADLSLRPRIARAWGPELVAPEGRLRLCVESGTPSHAPAQLAAGTPIAVTFTRPAVAGTIQVKGVIDELEFPTDAQLRNVEAHWLACVAEAELIGIA